MNAILRKLNARIDAADTLVCVGLDPVIETMPPELRAHPASLFEFCRRVIDATAPYTAAYKPNIAFFEAYGSPGIAQLERVAAYLQETQPGIVTICDAKRGDNANTGARYATAIFDRLGFDAVTLHAYLGSEALEPFLARDDKACILLCRTSNTGAREVQDLDCGGAPLWQRIAELTATQWDREGNCWLVVGATYPDELRRIRQLAPHTTFLVPGIGAQGGSVDTTIRAGIDASGRGLLLSSSRAITEAVDPAAAAKTLRDEIRQAITSARHTAETGPS
jgi:orotidine-5'-phosphate decarboxylase